jgi:hypothetical protein
MPMRTEARSLDSMLRQELHKPLIEGSRLLKEHPMHGLGNRHQAAAGQAPHDDLTDRGKEAPRAWYCVILHVMRFPNLEITMPKKSQPIKTLPRTDSLTQSRSSFDGEHSHGERLPVELHGNSEESTRNS